MTHQDPSLRNLEGNPVCSTDCYNHWPHVASRDYLLQLYAAGAKIKYKLEGLKSYNQKNKHRVKLYFLIVSQSIAK